MEHALVRESSVISPGVVGDHSRVVSRD
jgi:hypothetical protein